MAPISLEDPESITLPIVHIPENITFPFCILQPENIFTRYVFSAKPNYRNGSCSLADIFWCCAGHTSIRSALQPKCTGMLTGPVTVVDKPDQSVIKTRRKREPRGAIKVLCDGFINNMKATIGWNQEPHGAPQKPG